LLQEFANNTATLKTLEELREKAVDVTKTVLEKLESKEK
jgi:hypothetical protein